MVHSLHCANSVTVAADTVTLHVRLMYINYYKFLMNMYTSRCHLSLQLLKAIGYMHDELQNHSFNMTMWLTQCKYTKHLSKHILTKPCRS